MAGEEVGNLSVRVGLDTVAFNQGIKELSQKMQILGQEFKNSSDGLNKVSDAAEISRNKITMLTGKIGEQRQLVDQLKTAHANAADQYGETSRQAQAYELRLLRAEGTLQGMERELTSTTQQLEIQSSRWTTLGNAMQSASDRMKSIGEGMKKAGQTLSMAVTAPILAAGVASAKLASDLSENMNKVDVAFGKNAQEVKSWSSTTLKSFGISQGSALEMASLFGDMASGMDINTEQASLMSTKMVGLAGDLASFKNIGLDQASDALKGIFTGEGESLKSLGVIMLDSTLAAFALETGQKTLYKDMDQGEKVMLRYEYVLSKTKNSQGDFARTSEGTANQTRIFGETMKELGANIGQYILPVVTPLITKLSEMAQAFGDLSPATQKTILVIAGIAAAIGPVVTVVGTLISGVGAIAGVVGFASAAIAAAGGGMAVFGLAIAALTGPIGLTVLAIAGIVAGGIALYKHFSADAIPTVQLFGKETSEATKKAVGAYMDLDDKATKSLMSLNFSGKTVTKETADALTKNFDEMGTQIKAGMDKHYGESFKTMQDFFGKSSVLTTTEEATALAAMTKNNEDKKKSVDDGEKAIKLILDTASTAKRALTTEEQTKINEIQATMKTNAVKALSDTELESKSILERMKAHAGETTAQQAAEVVKNSLEQKTKAVKNAEDQYDQTVKAIIKQRDETGTITKEQADKLILEAGRQKDESVTKATEMNTKVVEQAKLQAKDHVKEVDWTTGEIKSKWQVMKEDTSAKMDEIGKKISDKWEEIKKDTSTKWEEIKKDVKQKVEDIKKDMSDKWEEIKKAVKDKVVELKADLLLRWEEIKKDVKNIDLLQIGKDIIQGLINGINNKMADLRGAVEEMASSLPGWIKKILGIQSPSTVMQEVGHYMIDGLVAGIGDKVGDVGAAMDGVVSAITSKASAFVAAGAALGTSVSGSFNTNLKPPASAGKGLGYNPDAVGGVWIEGGGYVGSKLVPPHWAYPGISFQIPELAIGTNFVPADMLAFLHKGEAVIPAKYNQDNSSSSRSITIINHGTIVGSNGMNEFADIVSRKIARTTGLAMGGAW